MHHDFEMDVCGSGAKSKRSEFGRRQAGWLV